MATNTSDTHVQTCLQEVNHASGEAGNIPTCTVSSTLYTVPSGNSPFQVGFVKKNKVAHQYKKCIVLYMHAVKHEKNSFKNIHLKANKELQISDMINF